MKFINNEKLKRINLKKDNFIVVIDFDRTITARESCDSWDASGKLLGEEYQQKNYELYKKYEPIELDYKISYDEKKEAMKKWYNETMNLFYEYNLTKEKLEKSIEESPLIFRKGAKEFLQEMNKSNIPIIILSAGIGNVIEQFLQKNNCLNENITIVSNYIPFDENGNIQEYKGPIIHTLNKKIKKSNIEQIEKNMKSREFRLLFGDFVEDKNMIPEEEWDKTISIGFLDKNVEDNLEVYKNSFDIVLTNQDATFDIKSEVFKI